MKRPRDPFENAVLLGRMAVRRASKAEVVAGTVGAVRAGGGRVSLRRAVDSNGPTTAAHRVFPETDWWVEVSSRPEPAQEPRECRDISGKYLHQLATGFAIRKRDGMVYERHGDLKSLGGDPSSFQRWGTDITVTLGGRSVRLLSVHLKSGCWSSREDESESSWTIASCSTLRDQNPRTQKLG